MAYVQYNWKHNSHTTEKKRHLVNIKPFRVRVKGDSLTL
jgi:hypothetical protein